MLTAEHLTKSHCLRLMGITPNYENQQPDFKLDAKLFDKFVHRLEEMQKDPVCSVTRKFHAIHITVQGASVTAGCFNPSSKLLELRDIYDVLQTLAIHVAQLGNQDDEV